MTVRQCLKQYARTGHLTDFEKTEILDFSTIYYMGAGAKKIAGKPGK
jgi:hypothetical protein